MCDAGEVRSCLITIDHRVCAGCGGCGGLEGDDAVAFCRLGVSQLFLLIFPKPAYPSGPRVFFSLQVCV